MTDVNGEIKDHFFLFEKSYEIIEKNRSQFEIFQLGDEGQIEKFEYGKSKNPGDFVVLGEDTALELGSPRSLSLSRVLWTKKENVTGNKLYIHNNLLYKISKKQVSILQLILVEIIGNVNPYDTKIYHLKNLSNKIAGYMTRSVPEKIWIRLSNSLMEKKFSLRHLGEALYKIYQEELQGIGKVDIVLVADNDKLIEEFKPINTAAKIITGENRKLKWEKDGVVSCSDLACDSCDEQEACDTIRDIIVKKRRKSE